MIVNMRQLRSTGSETALAPAALGDSDVLIAAAICAYEDAAHDMDNKALPRQPWAMQVLIEQLLDKLGPSRWRTNLEESMRDPQRGVTAEVADGVTLRLSLAGWLRAVGVRSNATWSLTHLGHDQTRLMLLSEYDRKGIAEAAQRAAATNEAWLKTFRAAAE